MHRTRYYYDRETRDYAMELDDQLVGYARTAAEAERTLAELLMSVMEHDARLTPVAAQTTEEA